jgi:hypothetical protein
MVCHRDTCQQAAPIMRLLTQGMKKTIAFIVQIAISCSLKCLTIAKRSQEGENRQIRPKML